MSNYILVGVFILGYVSGEAMIGPGIYNVVHISKCEGSEDGHLIIFDISRGKYNRTHDVFNASIILMREFDHTLSIQIDIYKCVDGGCKLHSVLQDDDMIHFIDQFGKDNVRSFLELADVHPPDFPLPQGTIRGFNYLFDYEELPDSGLYGKFAAHVMAMDNDKCVLGCIDIEIDFDAD